MTDDLSTRGIERQRRRMTKDLGSEKERLAQALRDGDTETFTEAIRTANSSEFNRGWADGHTAALDACNPIIDALTAERDALAEDEQEATRELDNLRAAAQEYFEASLPLLNDYPLTDSERRTAWQRLRETNGALRAALDLARLVERLCDYPSCTGPFGHDGGHIISRFELHELRALANEARLISQWADAPWEEAVLRAELRELGREARAALALNPTVCEVCGQLADGEPSRCHRHFRTKSDDRDR